MKVINWWYFMMSIALANIVIIMSCLGNVKTPFEMKLFILAFLFVFVNSIRSIWLRTDRLRICLHDNLISSPLLGRIVTTFSEIAFVLLIVLIYKKIVKRGNHNEILDSLLNAMVVIIVIAEVFCWKGVLSTNSKWNAIEESSWAVTSFLLTIVCIMLLFKETNPKIRTFIIITIIATIFYEIFMVKIDIPMYLKSANKVTTKAKGLLEQCLDMFKCKILSKRNKEWDSNIPWMTGYFSFGSWLAIALLVWYQYNRNLFKNIK